MSDEINLERAVLFINDAFGQYIPQYFAQAVKRRMVSGVTQWEWETLEYGPDHVAYWETWDQVLSNAVLHHPKLGKCCLWQDGDLWVVPMEGQS